MAANKIDQRGSKNKGAKLTEEIVIACRLLRQRGVTIGSLARLYDVHYTTMQNLLNYESWKHVHEEEYIVGIAISKNS